MGDLSRTEAERRIWRETQADRLTRFDRILLEEQAREGGIVSDGMGRAGSKAALLRARLGHLEQFSRA